MFNGILEFSGHSVVSELIFPKTRLNGNTDDLKIGKIPASDNRSDGTGRKLQLLTQFYFFSRNYYRDYLLVSSIILCYCARTVSYYMAVEGLHVGG